MSNTYAIDDTHGNQLATGLEGHDIATAEAKRRANERGEAVYLYPTGEGQDDTASEAIQPDSAARPGDARVDAMESLIQGHDVEGHITGDMTPRTVAILWVECVGDVATAEPYMAAGCWNEEYVAELIAAGITADQLARAAAVLGLAEVGNLHSNGDLSTAEIKAALADA
jgi:hypothetical protein